jgi:hypothetical protein
MASGRCEHACKARMLSQVSVAVRMPGTKAAVPTGGITVGEAGRGIKEAEASEWFYAPMPNGTHVQLPRLPLLPLCD